MYDFKKKIIDKLVKTLLNLFVKKIMIFFEQLEFT